MTDPQDFLNALQTWPEPLDWSVVPLMPAQNAHVFRQWLDAGYAGTMDFLHKTFIPRVQPRELLVGYESVVMLLFAYPQPLKPIESAEDSQIAEVSAYACGEDYHLGIKSKVFQFMERLDPPLNSDSWRVFTDSYPFWEREFAAESGLGWRGKNTCLISAKHGSAFFIASIAVKMKLSFSRAPHRDFCGGCTRCIEACPTGALVAPGVLDSRKCISYLTIEAKEDLTHCLDQDWQGRIFGCDICQQVCPWNHKHLLPSTMPKEWPQNLEAWLKLCRRGGGFGRIFRKAPLNRAGRKGLLRSAAILCAQQKQYELRSLLLEIAEEEEDEFLRNILRASAQKLVLPKV
jgi:epoxyqueuosine reductase